MRVTVQAQADAILQAYADGDGITADEQRDLVGRKIVTPKQAECLGQILGSDDTDGITAAERKQLARKKMPAKLIAKLSGPDGTLALQRRTAWFVHETHHRLGERDGNGRVDAKEAARWLERGVLRGDDGLVMLALALQKGNADWQRVALQVLTAHPELLQSPRGATLSDAVKDRIRSQDPTVQSAALHLLPDLPLSTAERDGIFARILKTPSAGREVHLKALHSWQRCTPPAMPGDALIGVSANYMLDAKVREAAIAWITQLPDAVHKKAIGVWAKNISLEYDGIAVISTYLHFVRQHGSPGDTNAVAIIEAALESNDVLLQAGGMGVLTHWGRKAQNQVGALAPVVVRGRFAEVTKAIATLDRIACASMDIEKAIQARLAMFFWKEITSSLTGEEYAIRHLLMDYWPRRAACP